MLNTNLVVQLARMLTGAGMGVNDFGDKLHNWYTAIVFMLFTAVLGLRQYVMKPISCWVPQEYSRAWEEYAEYYCWISDTYYAYNDVPPQVHLELPRAHRRIGYYQWVPFMLFAQSISFVLPQLLWQLFRHRARVDLHAVVHSASNAAASLESETRNKHVVMAARMMERALARGHFVKKESSWVRTLSGWCPFNLIVGSSGSYLISLYLLVKALCIANTVLQMAFIMRFTGTNLTMYGLEMMYALGEGRDWEDTGVFPRVTWCDFKVWSIGKPLHMAVQCVLPANFINEKAYIFLWLWLFAVHWVLWFSLIKWLVKLGLPSWRRKYVLGKLKLLVPDDGTLRDRKARERFISHYLRPDGVFILHLLSARSDNVVSCDVLHLLWASFRGSAPAAHCASNHARCPHHTHGGGTPGRPHSAGVSLPMNDSSNVNGKAESSSTLRSMRDNTHGYSPARMGMNHVGVVAMPAPIDLPAPPAFAFDSNATSDAKVKRV